MPPRIHCLLATLFLTGAARAEDGGPSDTTTWLLLLLGLLAIGLYAAVRLRKD